MSETTLCMQCGTRLTEKDVDQDLMVASCPHCGAVFELGAGGREEKTRPEADSGAVNLVAPESEPADMAVARGISVQRVGADHVITRRWFSCVHVPVAVFALFWDGFMVNWYLMAITTGAYEMALFGILHAAVGFGLTYYVLCGFLNSTRVVLGKHTLTVRHGPLPWPGNRTIATKNLQQLWCKRVTHRNKNGVSHTYTLRAEVDDVDIDLVKGMPDATSVHFLERFIEDELGIVDRPMEGEFGR